MAVVIRPRDLYYENGAITFKIESKPKDPKAEP